MAEYSIKELEKFSGVKAHTIRTWEKRYALVKPRRTPTKVRLYSDSDLRKIMNVAIATNAGVKISKIASLSADQLSDLVLKGSANRQAVATPIDKLILATVSMDERLFTKELRKIEATKGFEATVLEVLYPLLEKIGVLWQTGEVTPAQEHFISNLIRQKMFVAIDRLPLPDAKASKVILFLPEHEFHEIGLLFYHYLVRHVGHAGIYLGQSVPYDDLKRVVAAHKPRWIITSIITPRTKDLLKSYVGGLARDFRKQKIILSGFATAKFDVHEYRNVTRIATALELKKLLK
jgi:MerR family transcriptional regulator, light-induced transcriptional regulator